MTTAGSERRADAGIPRLTSRDMAALEWLEDMRVIGEDDLAVLLGRLSGRGPVSASATRNAIARWVKLSLVKVEKLFVAAPRLVWLTEKGAALAGARRWREPGVGVLRHTALCARVRLWLDQRGLGGQPVTEWFSERRWRQQHPDAIKQGAHVPDAVVTTADGNVFAIEVEVSNKGVSRALHTAVALTANYDQVVYVVQQGSETARTVRTALTEAVSTMRNVAGQGRIHLLYLPESADSGEET